ncbi:SAF domain-containing protein [uncultured Friedmanniella sp.]|uniref:SAF domain-containing protein n=1 Tax=uncultured Friedmanniella sp. TaxID=335381 RepID=UPI0035C9F983
MVVAVSVALVIVGGLISAWAYSTSTTTQQVVAVRIDVPQGDVITRDDLQVVRVSLDPALSSVPAERLDTLVGQHAAVALTAGSLISDRAVTPTEVPAPGMSVVGLALGPGQLPAGPLTVGDKVRIVSTPGKQGDVNPSTLRSFTGKAVVIREADASGQTEVSVEVLAKQAAEIATRSATGNVALLLDARDR